MWFVFGLLAVVDVQFNEDMTEVTISGEGKFTDFKDIPTELVKATIKGEITEIGDFSFSTLENLQTVNFQITSTSFRIGSNTFFGCSLLKTINIPDVTNYIGESAFEGCNSLTEIEIPFSLTTISKKCFYKCGRLQKIDLKNVKSINSSAFSMCSALSDVKFSNSLETIESSAFNACKISQITLPNTLKYIGNQSFCFCTELTSITFPDSVEYIGEPAFYGCVSVKELTIPPKVETIFDSTFVQMKNLQKVKLNHVKKISKEAFSQCVKLNNIDWGDSLTYIGSNAFSSSGLEGEISLPSTIVSIDASAFTKTQIKSIIFNSEKNSIDNVVNENDKNGLTEK
ncbi:surface antigen BspA-like [Trichomonas vaginalis G3]|uniref:Surface antigen BspA-like n=1 Tax=Trichomonas vaginalis (strain ATCC PRA-98 / G3) TaxID=412133 RepID=A2F882_TRIV3|nr:surface antigen BspA-like [Trichomonas vaginalis G3]|eukprot:XP_001311832.1 surface antigen BspA-like [Trichomonas vaginalis G3]